MADYYYLLYDTQPTGVAVFDSTLFQVAQGGDVTHTEDFTNMRNPGQMPASEKFELRHIGIIVDPQISAADLSKIAVASFLQIRHLEVLKFWSPLPPLFAYSSWNGFSNQVAAATLNVTGTLEGGVALDPPLMLGGGEKFSIRLKTTQATAVSTKLVVVLRGVLTLP